MKTNAQFIAECRALITSIPFATGDMARLEHRLNQAIDLLESAPSISDHIATVEKDHFRTVHDTGANPCAQIVLNALRRSAGLPPISKDDLPAWDGKAYVMPPDSRLLANQ